MKFVIFLSSLFISFSVLAQNESSKTDFFEVEYDESTGKVMLTVEHINKEFLYMASLAGGVGSNDLGLDRGKINSTKIVKFVKRGNKLLLQQPNLKFRAESENLNEVAAVEEAFASSILWGFEIASAKDNSYKIDITSFLLHDANYISQTLKRRNEGTYKIDKTRSVIKSEGLMSFPKNVEFESVITFTGESKGRYIPSVAPTSNAVSIVQHQSFIALPDDKYTPRKYHPYSGFNNILYYDYASPIHEPLAKRYIARHRLEKKNPNDSLSEAIEPIVYYVDAGCPEPIKTALIEGASWWNQAFTAAGFENAFQVKELPKNAHPLDVRYNVIQWVHRSTRGWSYGASVVDPRTGEIIKGHVSLGSLRVRQDFMIAQGVLSPFAENGAGHGPLTEMALARLRQLSAHEVGHTIGLAHNFAASTNNRASVMDYPHPLIKHTDNQIDLSDAYDDKIGLWDKRAIIYGYSQTTKGEEERKLNEILRNTKEMGLLYMSDSDARPAGSAHPKAHLWDNGSDPIDELKRVMNVRKHSLAKVSENTLTDDTPYSELEKVIVPIYLMHRYQAEAVSKIIGGVDYNYAVKGFDEPINKEISPVVQYLATQALLNTLTPESLAFPEDALDLILPSAKGYSRNRESFSSDMNMVFDPLNAAEAYTNFVLSLMLHPDRLARMNMQEVNLKDYLEAIITQIATDQKREDAHMRQLSIIPIKVLTFHLIKLATNHKINKQVSAMAMYMLNVKLTQKLETMSKYSDYKANSRYLNYLISQLDSPEMIELPSLADMPPGSPIGCGE